MKPYSVVILTRNRDKAMRCLTEVEQFSPTAINAITVCDGIPLPDPIGAVPKRFVQGVSPFVFARNANIGIAHAGENDVFLLNDDAWLVEGTLDNLARWAQEHTNAGVVSARVTGMAAAWLNTPVSRFEDTEEFLPFTAVYLRRAVIDELCDGSTVGGGPLDERFVGYGYEDNDFCKRALMRGYQLAVCAEAHFSHNFAAVSEFRGRGSAGPEMLRENAEIYRQKWGGRVLVQSA